MLNRVSSVRAMNSMLACCMAWYVSRQVAASMPFGVHSLENFTDATRRG